LEARLGLNAEAAPAAPLPRATAPVPPSVARVAPKPLPLAPAPVAPAAAPVPAAEAGEDSEANWPSATEEAAFLSGPREEITLPVPPPETARSSPAETEPVPPVEELIKQIPAEVRAVLDELFRARFNRVMRAKPKTL
jgi:hypothetical protein